ncbi:MAG: TauD/TfdA family dioxygenase, partial [Solimonas sp.]
MAPQHKEQFAGPMAWRGDEITKEDISVDLSAKQVAALEDVLARVSKAGLSLREITAEQVRHPALDSTLEKVFDEIQHGRGIVILRGFPVDGHSVEEVGKMYWAVGAHFGRGVSQSALGDLLGQVQDETPPGKAESARGYLSRRELSLHN